MLIMPFAVPLLLTMRLRTVAGPSFTGANNRSRVMARVLLGSGLEAGARFR